MASNDNSGTQRVINETSVDPVTQQWRSQLMGSATGLWNKGAPQYYPGNTVVPFANQTQSGLDSLQRYAQGGAPNLQAANDAASAMLQGNNAAMPMARTAAAGGLASNPYGGALSQYGQATNPHLRSVFDAGAQDITNTVNSNFMQAGRYGANAAHTGALTRELGGLWSDINMPAYEAERNRGLAATQAGASLYDAGQNRTLQSIGLFGDLNAQANTDAQRTMALLPGLFQYGAMPGQTMMDIGGAYEGKAGEYLGADVDRYNYTADAPWDYLQRMSQIYSGMPDFSGSTTTQQGPGTNRAMSALGGAATGGALGGMLAGTKAGAFLGPWGMFGGAALGGLMGLF